jgi:hypothetical protein
MLRSLVALSTIVSLLTAMLLSPSSTYARRCPAEEPETLLSLYKTSEVIVIATFDRVEDVEIVEKEATYTAVKTRSTYSVTSVLKGENRKQLILDDTDYRYEPAVPSESDTEAPADPEVVVEVDEAPAEEDKIEPGDTVMMFLADGGEEEPGLRPVGYMEGIKELSGDTLRAYEARVNELNVIFRLSTNREAAIANWLVSVTEDPLTRWEGAFELLKSFEELEWAEEAAKEAAEADSSEESSEEISEADEVDTVVEESDVPESDLSVERQAVARAVTDGQKQILLYLLMNNLPEAKDGEKPGELEHGNAVLLQLVQRWGDFQLATALLGQLRADAGDVYYKHSLMDTIARSLADPDLASIGEKYSDRLWEEDTVEYSEEPIVTEGDQTDPVEGSESTEPPSVVVGEAKPEGEAAPGADGKAKQTFGERRAQLLVKFITRADQRIATQ